MGVFPDVSLDSSLCTYVEFLYHQETVSGYSNRNYGPEDYVSRGQISKVIKKAFDIPTDTSGDPFPDVSSDNVFYEEIMSLKNAGIVEGFSDGEYKPDKQVSRGVLMKFVLEAVNFKETYVSTGHDWTRWTIIGVF
jgi:hypothetical protein